jgi:hypothetical protein
MDVYLMACTSFGRVPYRRASHECVPPTPQLSHGNVVGVVAVWVVRVGGPESVPEIGFRGVFASRQSRTNT